MALFQKIGWMIGATLGGAALFAAIGFDLPQIATESDVLFAVKAETVITTATHRVMDVSVLKLASEVQEHRIEVLERSVRNDENRVFEIKFRADRQERTVTSEENEVINRLLRGILTAEAELQKRRGF